MRYTSYFEWSNVRQMLNHYVQGEHKKVAPPPTTFVDVSAMHEDFCMKFYTTLSPSLVEIY